MDIKILLTCAAMAATAAFAAGDTYYVDDDGSDNNSGTSPELTGEILPDGTPVGPKFTLKAGLGLAKSGDTVCVLPGHYREGVMTNLTYYFSRALVPDGVKLVSRDGRDVTFIYGAAASVPDPDNRTDAEKEYELGEDAVRCAYLQGSGSIFGFTLLDGHTGAVAGGKEYGYYFGGGVYCAGTGCAVDCVISNCFAVRGAAVYGSRTGGLVNSIVTDCRGTGAGAGLYLAKLWNCVVDDNLQGTYQIYNSDCYNCTLNIRLRGSNGQGPGISYGWNTVLAANDEGYNVMTNTYTSSAPHSYSDWSSPDNRTKLVLATQLLTDSADMPVFGSHVGIDKGNWFYYTNDFPAVARDYMYLDAYGRKRVVNGALDVGAVEYDYFDTYASDLAASGYFSVTSADVGICRKEVDGTVVGVAIPVGSVLEGEWNIPEYDTYPETYSISAELSGDAVLKVYVDGQLKLTLKESSTAEYVFSGVGHSMRFVCEGTTGEAVLAALATTAHKPYFVSPAPKGNDDNDGLTPDTPKETLSAIAALATASGCVIHAASGVYNKGASGRVVGAVTTNRVILAAGVGLVGDAGAAETAIEGLQNVGGYEHATNVMRCCYLNNGAWIRGFTLRNGAAAAVSGYGETGGALTGNGDIAAIDCVFTNNTAVRGTAVSEATLIRCRVIANGAGTFFGEYYGSVGTVVDCVFSGGAYLYSKAAVVNSTFETGSQIKSQTRDGYGICGTNETFNSIIYVNNMNRSFRNCAFRSNKLNNADSCSADADCRFGVTDALDANMRPVAGATNLIDRGKNEYYDTYFPKKWLRFKECKDFAGGSRVYSAKSDIGAGEYDARSDFARRLARRLTVDTATPNVELGEETGLTMKGGDVLEMRWQLRQGGTCQFRAVGAGGAAVIVSVGGVELQPDASGVYSFAGSAGEQTVSIACFGAGTATVDSFLCPPYGVIMTVR